MPSAMAIPMLAVMYLGGARHHWCAERGVDAIGDKSGFHRITQSFADDDEFISATAAAVRSRACRPGVARRP